MVRRSSPNSETSLLTDVAVKLVKAHRAWANVRGPEGWTPLHCACYNGDTSLVNALLQAGANYDLMDGGGGSPMHWAAESGCCDVVKALSERGASVESIDHSGGTPMHLQYAPRERAHPPFYNLIGNF